jgi:hypothetical protein
MIVARILCRYGEMCSYALFCLCSIHNEHYLRLYVFVGLNAEHAEEQDEESDLRAKERHIHLDDLPLVFSSSRTDADWWSWEAETFHRTWNGSQHTVRQMHHCVQELTPTSCFH